MIRGVLSALLPKLTPSCNLKSPSASYGTSSSILKSLITQQNGTFPVMAGGISPAITTSQWFSKRVFLQPQKISSEQRRTVIKYSLKSGKRKTVKAVVGRFFRLHWGIWIRTMAGRHKKLWLKSAIRRNRLLGHVFCNATQSRMLDTMVTKFWRKPKYYIDDPYKPYHTRENFYITRKKPWRPEGVDYE